MLTVAIPTFNRPAQLLRTLERVLPQLDRERERARLLIIDNASPIPVEELLQPLLECFPDVQVDITRNRANIGANANILRCFELCQTPYLWTLSDDDLPKTNAIEVIFKAIEDNPNCVFWNFGVEHEKPRSQTIFTRGAVEFARRIDSFGNTIFISSNVYRNDLVMGALKFAHHYTYAAVPQFVMVIQSLQKDSVCCFSHRPLVSLGIASQEQQWSRVVLAMGIRTLLEMPLDPPLRAALARPLLEFEEALLPSRQIAFQLAERALHTRDRRGALFFYELLRHRRHSVPFYGDTRPKQRLEAWACRFIVMFPRQGVKLIRWNYARKNLRSGQELTSFSERL